MQSNMRNVFGSALRYCRAMQTASKHFSEEGRYKFLKCTNNSAKSRQHSHTRFLRLQDSHDECKLLDFSQPDPTAVSPL